MNLFLLLVRELKKRPGFYSHSSEHLLGGQCEGGHVEEVPDHPSLDVDIQLRVGVKAGGRGRGETLSL